MDADPAQLCTQRLRRGLDRLQQALYQGPRGRPAKEVGVIRIELVASQTVEQLSLRRLGERRVRDQFAVSRGGWVLGRDPSEQQFLQRRLTSGHIALVAAEPLSDLDLVAVHRQRRKGSLVDQQPRIHAGPLVARVEHAESPCQWTAGSRVSAPLDRHGTVSQLLHETDGGDLRGDSSAIGLGRHEALCQRQRARNIECDSVAIAQGKALVEAVAIAGGAGDTEIHRPHLSSVRCATVHAGCRRLSRRDALHCGW